MRGTWNHGRNYGSHGYYNHESMCKKDRISGHTIILYGSRRKNGKKYQLMMTEVNRVSVIEKGQDSGVILTGDSNLSDATYKTTLQNLSTRF